MILDTLRLNCFRSYEKAYFSFKPGINLIYGPNGAGKTNLLEAISLLSTGRSFRSPKLIPLIKQEREALFVEGNFTVDNVSQTLQIGFSPDKKEIHYNHTAFRRFSDLLGILPTVTYAPHDINLIMGSPQIRRRFLNLMLAQQDPLYIYHLVRYTSALKQRNTLLKKGKIDTIDVWEHEMAKSALYLMEKRKSAILELKALIDPPFSLVYIPSLKQDTPLQEQYARMRKKELYLKTTLLGPHRDDILFTFLKQDAKTYASEGQKRSCIARLRFAEWEQIKKHLNCAPLLLVDDFSIHLDQDNTKKTAEILQAFPQVFITSPHEKAASFFEKKHLIKLNQLTKNKPDAILSSRN